MKFMPIHDFNLLDFTQEVALQIVIFGTKREPFFGLNSYTF